LTNPCKITGNPNLFNRGLKNFMPLPLAGAIPRWRQNQKDDGSAGALGFYGRQIWVVIRNKNIVSLRIKEVVGNQKRHLLKRILVF
jgi:hypothetical protein